MMIQFDSYNFMFFKLFMGYYMIFSNIDKLNMLINDYYECFFK